MSKRSFNSGAMRVLQPGEYTIVHHGKGKPGEGRPLFCLRCRKRVDGGDWVTRDNGQYSTIAHKECETKAGL